jgi:hypothetical protein
MNQANGHSPHTAQLPSPESRQPSSHDDAERLLTRLKGEGLLDEDGRNKVLRYVARTGKTVFTSLLEAGAIAEQTLIVIVAHRTRLRFIWPWISIG